MSEPSSELTAPLSDDQPPNTFILVTGIPVVNTPAAVTAFVVLPNAGTVWIGYEIGLNQKPAVYVTLWHQGGATEEIEPGFTTHQVGPGDILTYGLGDPAQLIKLGWAYV